MYFAKQNYCLLIVLIADIWAMLNIIQSRGSTGRKVLWIVIVLILPVFGLLLWLLLSPWRMPTINELESLVDASTHSPALPPGNLFAANQNGYWSSTTSLFETDWAYLIFLDKGKVGVVYK